MLTNILDLSAETILNIAYFLHGDNEIDLPSFSPHWANFAHDVDPSVQKDYFSFRSTCKRVKDLLPMKQLHIVFTKWSTIQRWKMSCPDTVLHGVKRVKIDILPKTQPPQPQRSHSNPKDYSIVDIWSTLTSFLEDLTQLEELIIVETPLCKHGLDMSLGDIRLPSRDFLGKLKSLAFECKCFQCSALLPILFIPVSPKIKHLKLWLEHEEDYPFHPISDSWASRHHESSHLPLETVYMKDTSLFGNAHVLTKIKRGCPSLRHVCVSGHKYTGSVSTTKIGAKPCRTGDDQWMFRILWEEARERTSLGYLSEQIIEACWKNGHSWLSDQLEKLGEYEHLERMDLYLELSIPPRYTSSSSYLPATKRSTYDRNRLMHPHTSIPTAEEQFFSAMHAAATFLGLKIPSLREGYFWQYPDADRAKGLASRHLKWRRWTWTRLNEHAEIHLSRHYEEFPVDWTNNYDGSENRWE